MASEPMSAEDRVVGPWASAHVVNMEAMLRLRPEVWVLAGDATRIAKEHAEATAVVVMNRMLRERDLLRTATEPLTACNRCRGNGVLLYGSGATYRRGPGGAVMKLDICNRCWGSGIKGAPWHDLRAFSSVVKERDAALAEVARLKEANDAE